MILPDLLLPHVEKHPSRTAFIFRDQVITYGELHQRVLSCAEGLSKQEIQKGSTVAVFLRNSPEFVILAMALSILGAILVPINFLEKPDRVALILNDAKAIAVLTSDEFLSCILKAKEQIPTLKSIFLRDPKPSKKYDATIIPFENLLTLGIFKEKSTTVETDLMMLLYTSGTTGLPKGVMLTHKNFISNADQSMAAISLSENDRFMCLLPMFHSFAWTTCVIIPLKLGCSILIIESLLPFDPVIKSIWKYKITLFVAVPQIFAALATKIKGIKALAIRLINPVRACICGAAPLSASIHENFEKQLGIPLLEGYGLTEAAPVVALNPEKKRKVGTVGPALPGVKIEIRDDNGTPLPQGKEGEIWVQGDNVMMGYYNKPEETKEALTSDRWLKTGDIGRFDEEGYLQIVDRKKDLIIIKGLNVYPQEIENVILQCDSVKEVAVVGKMDKETGEETIRAFVTEKEGMKIDKAQIMDLCKKDLALYKRPKEIIILKELPKNALQKVLKKDLRKYD